MSRKALFGIEIFEAPLPKNVQFMMVGEKNLVMVKKRTFWQWLKSKFTRDKVNP